MELHKLKCTETGCDKIIEGVSEKEVLVWMEQHKHYAHSQEKTE